MTPEVGNLFSPLYERRVTFFSLFFFKKRKEKKNKKGERRG